MDALGLFVVAVMAAAAAMSWIVFRIDAFAVAIKNFRPCIGWAHIGTPAIDA